MGLVKMLIYDGVRQSWRARSKAKEVAAKAASSNKEGDFGKSPVTYSDIKRLSDQVEDVRSEMHDAVGQVHAAMDHICRKVDANHQETIKTLIQLVKDLHGM